jgi:hypothetical protein
MTSEELKKLFEHYAEEAQFRDWSKGEGPSLRFVYACEHGTFWKFTPKSWWQFVTKAIRNNGGHDFMLSQALSRPPKLVVKGEDNKFSSSDMKVRCVSPLDWTLQDWENELIHGRRLTEGLTPDEFG